MFEGYSGGESIQIDGEYQEGASSDDPHVLECSTTFGSDADGDFMDVEDAIHVYVEIFEEDSTEHEDALGEMEDEIGDLEHRDTEHGGVDARHGLGPFPGPERLLHGRCHWRGIRRLRADE